jgi:gp16 family phage-associated protein
MAVTYVMYVKQPYRLIQTFMNNDDQLAPTNAIWRDSLNANNIQDAFRAQGITISDWAKKRGHNPQLVYMILRGERKCMRGKSFQIAQELKTM